MVGLQPDRTLRLLQSLTVISEGKNLAYRKIAGGVLKPYLRRWLHEIPTTNFVLDDQQAGTMSMSNNLRFTEISEQDKRLHDELRLAQLVAEESHDPSRQVGAVVVNQDGLVLVSSTNALPEGVKFLSDRVENRVNGEKYLWVEHAERNAVYTAAKRGIKLEDCRMVVTLFPCADCARAIIQSGISHLVVPKLEGPVERFELSTKVARQMLSEAGVRISEITSYPSSTPK